MTLHFGKSGILMLYDGESEALNLSPLRKIRDIKPRSGAQSTVTPLS